MKKSKERINICREMLSYLSFGTCGNISAGPSRGGLGEGRARRSLSVIQILKIDVMSYKVIGFMAEWRKTGARRAFLSSKWAIKGNFGVFSLTFTDILDVSMSVKPDIIRHGKCRVVVF